MSDGSRVVCALLAFACSGTGCAQIEPTAPDPLIPVMYPVPLANGTQCTAIENARGEALLICDFERIPNAVEVAKELL